LGKGGGVIRYVDQPLQHGVRVDLEHPGDGADAQALRQRAHTSFSGATRVPCNGVPCVSWK